MTTLTKSTTPRADAVAFLRRTFALRAAGVVYALLGLVVALSIISAAQGKPGYLSTVNVANILDQSALIAIMALFMTIVLITGNFDLSVASTAALSGTVALKLVDDQGTLVAIFAALATGAAVGTANALLVQKAGVNAFIVTLGTLTAVRGIVEAMLNGKSITAKSTAFSEFSNDRWTFPGWLAYAAGIGLVAAAFFALRRGGMRLNGAVAGLAGTGLGLLFIAAFRPGLREQTAPVWLLLALTVVASLVLRFTVVGRNAYACGGSAEAARMSGINVGRYRMGAFVLNGLAAGGVGVLYAGKFNSVDPTVLTGGELTVIAAAILGGTSLFGGAGYVVKSVVGALVLFTLSNGFNVLNIGSNYQRLVQGCVLVAAASLYTAAGGRGTSRLRRQLARLRGAPAEGPAPPPPADGRVKKPASDTASASS